jgi:hypothetical protein
MSKIQIALVLVILSFATCEHIAFLESAAEPEYQEIADFVSEVHRGYYSYFKFIEDDDNLCSPITAEGFKDLIEKTRNIKYKNFSQFLIETLPKLLSVFTNDSNIDRECVERSVELRRRSFELLMRQVKKSDNYLLEFFSHTLFNYGKLQGMFDKIKEFDEINSAYELGKSMAEFHHNLFIWDLEVKDNSAKKFFF